MKEYKYIINGTQYDVQIGDIVENIANVTVNGEEFKVEMEGLLRRPTSLTMLLLPEVP